ncbi:hypothetical protein ANANG_G00258000 [Anguilla anguilla]|uniref:RING-type E3 ubiquitin transferase n=1 Tax=Anguilla anguilla TaxID=7936 RepID=A0A9D3RL24_ANGAN|nr:hypothetical protein ANANG_G00258000 [Anguilla anguilla]
MEYHRHHNGKRRVGAAGASAERSPLSAAMTTSRCSQLPRCCRTGWTRPRAAQAGLQRPRPLAAAGTPDRPGPAHTGKAVDEPSGRGGGQPHPLVERPMCRICHEGSGQEELLSPCECAGTLGTIHRSCLEHWLSASSTSMCELCHFQFSVQRKTRPLLEWVRSPGLRQAQRTLLGDMVCFLLITPLATISGWLCLRGAVDHLHFSSRLEAVGLIALTVALFTIYLFWTLVSLRYHCRLYNEWRQTNQRVVLLLPKTHGEPPAQQPLTGPPPAKRPSKETIV